MATKKASKKAKGVVEERPADAPFPPSGANELRDNATTAAAITASVDGESGAKAAASTVDSAAEQLDAKEAKAAEEEDNSLFGKIRRSGLFHVVDHVLDQTYIGVSPAADPDSTPASRSKSVVTGLDIIPPRTGMEVRPKNGEPFAIGDGFDKGTTPNDWARVTTGDGKPLFG